MLIYIQFKDGDKIPLIIREITKIVSITLTNPNPTHPNHSYIRVQNKVQILAHKVKE